MTWIHGVVTTTMLEMLARKCPRCGRSVIVPLSQRRRTVPCPRCKTPLLPKHER